MNTIEITKQQFVAAKKQFDSIKQQCENEVYGWVWATSTFYEPEPFYFERNKHPKGRILKQEPDKKAYKVLCGLNKNNEVVVEHDFNDDGKTFYKTYYIRKAGIIEKYRFHWSGKKLLQLEQFWYDNGQVIENHFYDEDKVWLIETYEYSNEKLIASHRKHMYSPPSGLIESDFQYGYNEIGEISRILWDNKPCYIAPDKKKSAAQLIELCSKKLHELSYNYLKQVDVKEKLFAIALHYGNDDYFPPSIAMCTEQQRIEWVAKEGKNAKQIIWLPIEYEYNYDFYDNLPQETKNLFELCNQEVSMLNKDTVARTAIAKVAQQLNNQKLDFRFDTTDDFIIFATDYELADLKKNIKLIDPTYYEQVKKELP